MEDHVYKQFNTQKFLTSVVGVAAVFAFVLVGVTGERPATFLGGLVSENAVEGSVLFLSPEQTTVAKGRTFSVDVALQTGVTEPKDVRVTLQFDPEFLEVSYIDGTNSSLEKEYKKSNAFNNGTGEVLITGELIAPTEYKPGQILLARVYFKAKQSIGETELSFKNGLGNSSVTAEDGSEVLAGRETSRVMVSLN